MLTPTRSYARLNLLGKGIVARRPTLFWGRTGVAKVRSPLQQFWCPDRASAYCLLLGLVPPHFFQTTIHESPENSGWRSPAGTAAASTM